MEGRTDENSLSVLSKKYEQIIIDENTTAITYVGYAEFGVATAAARWVIIKITATSPTSPAGVTTIQYATGYNNATNIWDDRVGLSYVS